MSSGVPRILFCLCVSVGIGSSVSFLAFASHLNKFASLRSGKKEKGRALLPFLGEGKEGKSKEGET